MSTVKLKAKILDFNENPKGDVDLIVESFLPPYFNSSGSALRGSTRIFKTPSDEEIKEIGQFTTGDQDIDLTKPPIDWIVVSSDDGNTLYIEDIDYSINRTTGVLDRIGTGSIPNDTDIMIRYLSLSNGEVDIDLSRELVVKVTIPFSGYDIIADLREIPGATTEVTLEDLLGYKFLQPGI